MVVELIGSWSGPGRTPKLNIWHGADGAAPDAVAAAVRAFYDGIKAEIADTYSVAIEPNYRILDATTGAMTDAGLLTTGTAAVEGTSSLGPLPDAVSALVRWNTGMIVNGRFLKGRTFVPGVSYDNLTGGNMSAGCVTTFNTAAAALVNLDAGFAVWSRTAGVVHPVIAGDTWTEYATQRRRRG